MTARVSQHRILNGIILPQFCEAVGIYPSKDNVEEVKKLFKRYLKVASTAALSDRDMSMFIQAVCMLSAREFGVELTFDFAKKTMIEILNEVNYDFNY
jgi:hypothetical protein